MKHLLLALLFSIPTLSRAQAIPFEQRGPLISFTASAVNIFHYNQNGHNRTMWGWSATPAIRITSRLGMQADVSNSYMKSVYPGQSRLIVAGGPRYTFPLVHRVLPFAFAEGGQIRTRPQGRLRNEWNPLATFGIGFEYVSSRRLAFTLIPAEYVGQKEDDDTWTHSFAARAGITFNF